MYQDLLDCLSQSIQQLFEVGSIMLAMFPKRKMGPRDVKYFSQLPTVRFHPALTDGLSLGKATAESLNHFTVLPLL